MTGGQAEFTAALLDAARAVPEGLTGPDGGPAGKRFSVYRNNVAVSLTRALETAFPVIRKLVGEEFFSAMAGLYLRAHPPETPLLMFYGQQFPAFLQGFAPVAHLPYLPDVARLELALRESYHAADASPVPAETLGNIAPEALAASRLRLSPALRLVRSGFPIVGIWQANMQDSASQPARRAEDALVTRPGFDPDICALPPGGAAIIAALAERQTILEAVNRAETEVPAFDPSETLALLIGSGAITGIERE